MPTGKRASMREGPLAALFRKTAEDTGAARESGAGADAEPSAGRRAEPRRRAQRSRRPEAPAPPPPAPPEEPERRIPSPQERLRHAFSADIPENVMAAPEASPRCRRSPTSTPAPRRRSDSPASPVGAPVLRVVGVGGAGVNAVNRMVEAEIEGVEFIAINTDLQSLQQSAAHETLHIGDVDHPRPRLGLEPRSRPRRPRARSTTASRRCCAARTWSSSPPARAAGPAPAPRRSSPRSPASSAR